MRHAIDIRIESDCRPHKPELYFIEMLFTDIEMRAKSAEVHWRQEIFREYRHQLPFQQSQTRYRLTDVKSHAFRFYFNEGEDGLVGRLDSVSTYDGDFRDSGFRRNEDALDIELSYELLRWSDKRNIKQMVKRVNDQIQIDMRNLPVNEKEIYQRVF